MTERVGIIDLGSNSARLIVMNIYYNGSYNLVYHQKESIRLSEGMSSTNRLEPAAMERAVTTLSTFSHMCELFGATKIIAVATAAARNAVNGSDFLRLVQTHTSIPLQVISGEEEAYLGYIGTINTLDTPNALIFDLGGASTELTLVRNRTLAHSLSLPFGAVTLSEKFQTHDKISEDRLTELYNYIMRQLEAIPWLEKMQLPLIGIGGTMRNVAKMDQRVRNYPFTKVHNYKIGTLSFAELWRSLVEKTADQRRKIPGLSSDRADIIVAGTTIIKCLLAATRGTQLIVSGCGVREGLFYRYYLQKHQMPDIIPDIVMHSARTVLMFCKGNVGHADHVVSLASAMFDGWPNLHHLGSREKTLLQVAALLHDIGISINYYDHARHSSYLVENARLFGLTHREQMLCAVIAGWHNGVTAKFTRNRLYSEFLDEGDWSTARKLALLLALAECLDTSQMQLIGSVKASVEGKKSLLTVKGSADASLELKSAAKLGKWFKKEFGLDLVIGRQ